MRRNNEILIMTEINGINFYPMKGFEDKYLISKSSEIYGLKSKKILKPLKDKEGYLYVTLARDGKVKNLKVHRLMGYTFLDNSENKKEINHKDGNVQNNTLDNLEWCTRAENHNHAVLYGKIKKVKCCNIKNGNIVNIYESYNEASKINNINIGNIRTCCMGKANKVGGIYFRLYDELNFSYIKTKFDTI